MVQAVAHVAARQAAHEPDRVPALFQPVDDALKGFRGVSRDPRNRAA